jgi:hypothetical protein
VALADSRGDVLDLRAVADIALLRLGIEFGGDALEAIASAREENAAPASLREPARDRLADPARPPCYDGDRNSVSVPRLIATVSSMGSA